MIKMLNEAILNIIKNEEIANNIFCMQLSYSNTKFLKPNQFINIKIDNKFLRRPISICDWDEKSITIVYKVVGQGTKILSSLKNNSNISALIPLGNGFDINPNIKLIIGGGIGVPPLLSACKQLKNIGCDINIVLGFINKKEIFFEEEFGKYGNLIICTDDGSYGEKGLVTDVINKYKFNDNNYITCGPLPMEKAIYNTMKSQGQISLESRMGCGFGGCMGCSIQTKEGPKRICKDGPVFNSEVLQW